jgi:phosphoribosylformylglycinamidine synthase single chain form
MIKLFGNNGKTCLYVIPSAGQLLTENDINIICATFDANILTNFPNDSIEVGPMPSMESPWGSNAKSILKKCGVNVHRIEMSRIYASFMFDKSRDMDRMTEMIYEKEPNFQISPIVRPQSSEIISIQQANDDYQLGFDDIDIQFYENIFNRLGRKPTLIELMDLSQSNSEHSRHWFFKGKLNHAIMGEIPESLFQMVKNTLKHVEDEELSERSIIAFSDNSSSIEGFEIDTIIPINERSYEPQKLKYDISFTAETHNFPTGIAPFQGATTGTGGRIRDNQSIGRGGLVVAGTAGYCVGEIDSATSQYHEKNLHTLLKASDGASDYGNKFGEPLIGGFCRTFGITNENNQRIEWVKPIMFSGGIGQLMHTHSIKHTPEPGMLICKIGGPAYRIGVGGGAASSRDQNSKNLNSDLNAVQRGDAEMENKMNRVIRTCIELNHDNPILSIHDQGAGGTGNVTKEIVYNSEKGTGALVDLSKIISGDPTMNDIELWISEYQEQNTVLIMPKHQKLLEEICKRENVPFAIIGVVDGSGSVTVQSCNGEVIADFPLEPILGKSVPRKEFLLKPVPTDTNTDTKTFNDNTPTDLPQTTIINSVPSNTDVLDILSMPSVGSKRFLTNKVDRSVTGLIAQQQCVGPLHTPVSDYAVIAQSHFSLSGAATSVGERPIVGMYDPRAMAGMALGEMLTNLVFAQITNIHDIRISGNWMWPLKLEGEALALYDACDELTKLCKGIGVAIDGGKDSLSMIYKESNETVIPSPRQLVLSAYAPMSDIRHKVTANLKYVNTAIMFIDLAFGKCRMGGSALNKVNSNKDVPKMENAKLVRDVFKLIQEQWYVDSNMQYYSIGDDDYCIPYSLTADHLPVQIISGHDRSDGGLFTTICEMAIAGNIGVNLSSKYKRRGTASPKREMSGTLFPCEDPRYDIFLSTSSGRTNFVSTKNGECEDSSNGEVETDSSNSQDEYRSDCDQVENEEYQQTLYELKQSAGSMYNNLEFWFNEELGLVLEVSMIHVEKISNLFHDLETQYETEIVHYLGRTCKDFSVTFDDTQFDLNEIRRRWEKSSLSLEEKQCNVDCVNQERTFLENIEPNLNIMHYPNPNVPISEPNRDSDDTCNTVRPKVAIIREEGSNGDREMASAFYMAGFDVYDICMNDFIDKAVTLEQFQGVAFVGGFSYSDVGGAAKGWYQVIQNNKHIKSEFDKFYNREDTFSLGVCNGCQLMSLLGWIPGSKLVQNESNRFESRFPRVEITKSNAMMFKNMEDSVLGVWVAHGEGQFVFESSEDASEYVACRYVDENCEPTQSYPHNPNGSQCAAAALCSSDGRHLAMMPHPERCFLTWQLPYQNGLIFDQDQDQDQEKKYKKFSPWFGMFCNAYDFCTR